MLSRTVKNSVELHKEERESVNSYSLVVAERVRVVITGWILRGWRQTVVTTLWRSAAKLGVARSALGDWKSSRRQPDTEFLVRVESAIHRYFRCWSWLGALILGGGRRVTQAPSWDYCQSRGL